MPYYRFGHNGFAHIKFSGKLRKNPPAPCCAPIELDGKAVRCMAMSAYACDYPTSIGGVMGTCDAPLCEQHALQIGPDRHLCPKHVAAAATVAQAALF